VLLQAPPRRTSAFPPGFARIFNRRVWGVVTKTDSAQADVPRAQRFLQSAGLQKYYAVSTVADANSGTGKEGVATLCDLRTALFPHMSA